MTKQELVDARIREMVKARLVERLVPDFLVDQIVSMIIPPEPYSWKGWEQAINDAVVQGLDD